VGGGTTRRATDERRRDHAHDRKFFFFFFCVWVHTHGCKGRNPFKAAETYSLFAQKKKPLSRRAWSRSMMVVVPWPNSTSLQKLAKTRLLIGSIFFPTHGKRNIANPFQ
jgi:hypothetical protein